LIAGKTEAVEIIEFPLKSSARLNNEDWVRHDEVFAEAKAELMAYFHGDLKSFTFGIAPKGTEFQMAVWAALKTIPYGQTISYGDLARTIGRPRAVRAVGAANGANPLPIILPCHRVIGADGSLTGFGGGLDVKEALLTLEGVLPKPEEAAPPQADLFS